MNGNGHSRRSLHELMVVLEVQALVEARIASWESPPDRWNPRLWALCNHDRESFWHNQGGRRVCPVCHPPVHAGDAA